MRIKILSILLVVLGLLQSFGHLIQDKNLKHLALITMASPLPIVFTQQKGFLETFAFEFTLLYTVDGVEKNKKLTAEIYSQLDKPYHYRNVLGAAISYGPILPERLVSSVLSYALLDSGELTKLLGITRFDSAKIELKSKTKNVDKVYYLPIGERK